MLRMTVPRMPTAMLNTATKREAVSGGGHLQQQHTCLMRKHMVMATTSGRGGSRAQLGLGACSLCTKVQQGGCRRSAVAIPQKKVAKWQQFKTFYVCRMYALWMERERGGGEKRILRNTIQTQC